MTKMFWTVLLVAAAAFQAAGCGSGSVSSTVNRAGSGGQMGGETFVEAPEAGTDADSIEETDAGSAVSIVPGHDQASAAQLPFGEKINCVITSDDAQSWYSFPVDQAGTYTLTAVNLDTGGDQVAVGVQMYDIYGNVLGSVSAQYYGAPETITNTDLEPGTTYYIDVTGRAGTEYVMYLTSPDQDYDPASDLKAVDEDSATIEAGTNTTAAPLIPVNHEYTQTIGDSLNDWYAFRTGSGMIRYSVTTEKTSDGGSDISVRLFDKLGNIVGNDDTDSSGRHVVNPQSALMPDTVYYIAVIGDKGTDYTVAVSDTGNNVVEEKN